MIMPRITLPILILASASVCYAESNEWVEVKKGFLTGNSFRELSHPVKRGYAAGFIDGLFMSPIFDAPKAEVRWIEACAEGMSSEQIVAILNKYLADNPARWHESMNVLAWVAMKESCKR